MILFAFFVLILLGVLVPGILLSNIEGQFSLSFWIMVFIVEWAVIRLVCTGLTGQRRLTLMLFYVFVYVFMGVQPLLSIWSNIFPHSFELYFSPQMASESIYLFLVGLIGFEVGYNRITTSQKRVHNPNENLKSQRRQAISIFAIWSFILVVTCLFLLALLRYGPNVFLGLRGGGFTISEYQGVESTATENQLVIFGLRGIAATLLFIVLYLWKNRRDLRRKKSLKTVLIYSLFLNILISNPLNSPRLWSGSVILTSIIILLPWNKRSFLTWTTVGSLVMLFLFSGTDPRVIFSKQLLRGENITMENTVREVGYAIEGLPADPNFDAFQMIFYSADYTAKMGYSWGSQLLLPLLFWIPRSVWTNKPLGTSDIVATHAGFGAINVSSPLWSEGYVNFGVAGVFLFLFVFGRFARFNDGILLKRTVRPAFSTILSSFFAANTFILLRGDLTSGTMYLQMIIAFTFVFLVLSTFLPRYLKA